MEESLYSESGFFNTTKVRSNIEGDFLTSPEVSKYFGKFISHWMNENKIKEAIENYEYYRKISLESALDNDWSMVVDRMVNIYKNNN